MHTPVRVTTDDAPLPLFRPLFFMGSCCVTGKVPAIAFHHSAAAAAAAMVKDAEMRNMEGSDDEDARVAAAKEFLKQQLAGALPASPRGDGGVHVGRRVGGRVRLVC